MRKNQGLLTECGYGDGEALDDEEDHQVSHQSGQTRGETCTEENNYESPECPRGHPLNYLLFRWDKVPPEGAKGRSQLQFRRPAYTK